ALRVPFSVRAGVLIDDRNVRAILPDVTKPLVTYGLADEADLRATDVVNIGGRLRFVAEAEGVSGLRVELALPGVHNVRNALAAIAVGREVGVRDAAIARALAGFKGVGRRFQRYGSIGLPGGAHAELIDDYGHHPAEIAAVLDAARGSFPDRPLVLAFQP